MISFRTFKSALIHGDAAIGVSEAAKSSSKSDDESTRLTSHDELQEQDEGERYNEYMLQPLTGRMYAKGR